jgi:hypothetical protein
MSCVYWLFLSSLLSATILSGIGIPDFSMHDLATPTLARTRAILSGLVNFLLFADENLDLVQEEVAQLVRTS